MDYLTDLLRARGYQYFPVVQEEVGKCTSHFTGVVSRFGIGPGGRDLLCLRGSLPLQNNQSSLSVVIWIKEDFPHSAPICSFQKGATGPVNNDPNLSIAPTGEIHHPLLSVWNYSNPSILDLVFKLQSIYNSPSENIPPRPVRSKKPTQSQPTNGYANTNSSNNATGSNLYNNMNQMDGGVKHEERMRVKRLNEVKNQVDQKLQRYLSCLENDEYKEMEQEMQVSEQLKKNEILLQEALDKVINEMNRRKRILEQMKIDEQQMRSSLENYLKKSPFVSVDEIVVTNTPLYNQILNTVAEDHAYQDILYHFAGALNKGVIDLQDFIKNVRIISRHQFLARATTKKALEEMG